jgi:hypothetical protein
MPSRIDPIDSIFQKKRYVSLGAMASQNELILYRNRYEIILRSYGSERNESVINIDDRYSSILGHLGIKKV